MEVKNKCVKKNDLTKNNMTSRSPENASLRSMAEATRSFRVPKSREQAGALPWAPESRRGPPGGREEPFPTPKGREEGLLQIRAGAAHHRLREAELLEGARAAGGSGRLAGAGGAGGVGLGG